MKINQLVQNQDTYQLRQSVVKPAASDTQAPVQQAAKLKYSDAGVALAQQYTDDKRDVIYDQPNFKTSVAIQSYSAIQNQERRSEVQSLLGVSIYA
ncbi:MULTISPECIES: hypothetical protein [Pseudoalteromonas]|uniref:Uncharacterized protein n=1 Tax=Pseudoalteromonas rubra TaxID=43658 RepID=A0A5S3UQT5_9GAMM|nr:MULTISPECIES: hypothetical protein [Pseudoalteromonas]MCG7560020.1 hypothetical protein [Pseudoalteromonas sp. McH1-42]MEC4089044.1 hypothetical protein [Pseudoalteromonas rubra]QPB86102.1 hypothetical protein CWC22_024205 [Pseudoalteromonas rubra]